MKMKWQIVTDDGNEYRIMDKMGEVDVFSGQDRIATIKEEFSQTDSYWETPNKAQTYYMTTAVERAILDFKNLDSLNLEGIETIQIVGERPSTLPAGWIVFNAARPLAGSLIEADSDRALASGMVPNVWTGVFISGVFYAAVDPADDDAQQWIDQNRNLDARVLKWIPVADHRARVEEWAEQLFAVRNFKSKGGSGLSGIDFEDIDLMYRNHSDVRIIDPINIYDG
jgi:hypothetical protein